MNRKFHESSIHSNLIAFEQTEVTLHFVNPAAATTTTISQRTFGTSFPWGFTFQSEREKSCEMEKNKDLSRFL